MGETFRFTLRTGVKFHDGADFDCSVVKLNFDHVWAGGLTGPDWHGWYGLPGALKDWSCDGETFVLNTNKAYYPLLQELSYIRPMACSRRTPSSAAPPDPLTQNSCPTGWGTVAATADRRPSRAPARRPSPARARSSSSRARRMLTTPITTTSWWSSRRTLTTGMLRNTGNIEKVHVVRYDDSAAVKAAMLDGSLDAVLGAEVLAPSDEDKLGAQSGFDLTYGTPQMTTVIIMNIADKEVGRQSSTAIDKAAIIASELNDAYEPADRLFPTTMPYCDIP